MKNLIIILMLILLAPLHGAHANDADAEALEAARLEVERAREVLRDATRELERLAPHPVAPHAATRLLMGRRPMVGIVMGPGPEGRGVQLTAVTPGAPAERAGLKSGDIILSINGETLDGHGAVHRAYQLMAGTREGDRYELVVESDGEQRTESLVAEPTSPRLAVDLEGRAFGMAHAPQVFSFNGPDMDHLRLELDRLGQGDHFKALQMGDGLADIHVWNFGWQWSALELARMNPGLGRYFSVEEGALVLSTEGLEDPDLQAGDVITEVAGTPVSGPKEVMRQLRDVRDGESVAMAVIREGRSIAIEVTAPKRQDDGFFYRFRAPPAPSDR